MDAGVYSLREMFLAVRNIPHRYYLGSNLAVSESLKSESQKELLVFHAAMLSATFCLLDAGHARMVHADFGFFLPRCCRANPFSSGRTLDIGISFANRT